MTIPIHCLQKWLPKKFKIKDYSGLMIISVIIIAYDRKNYLLNAIKSVLMQTLSRNYYEIIIIKNYADEEIDKYIKNNNLINIYSKEHSLSGKIYEAVKISSGEIVAFLEDDDQFYREKLQHVYNVFKSAPDINYYHNSARFVDENYEPLKLSSSLPDFNLSSIAIRKKIIYLECLKKMPDAIDTFLYYNALDVLGKIINDTMPLTYYMFHSSSSNYIGGFYDTLVARLKHNKKLVKHYSMINECLKSKVSKKQLLNLIINTKIRCIIIESIISDKKDLNIGFTNLLFWLFFPVYYNRKVPFLFKTFRLLELLLPSKFKLIVEKREFEKEKANLNVAYIV
jgi:glycosyltransferase involved in cell wall biosynthesis